MNEESNRRSFLKKLGLGGVSAGVLPYAWIESDGNKWIKDKPNQSNVANSGRAYNGAYRDAFLNRVAFPLGGMGAGMFCLEGTGAISHLSIRNRPEIFNEPGMFGAVVVKGLNKGAKVIEGPVPDWKKFGQRDSGNGSGGSVYGLPRFHNATFQARFPFSFIDLEDEDLPLKIRLCGWSPFIPGDEDNSSMPFAMLEYKFINSGKENIEAIFSYNARNFLREDKGVNSIQPIENGFVLSQSGTPEKPFQQGDFAIYTDAGDTVVDHCWFRGGWFDPLTIAWETIRKGETLEVAPVDEGAPGASLYVPFSLRAGDEKVIRLFMAWYVPESNLHFGGDGVLESCEPGSGCCNTTADLHITSDNLQPYGTSYKPWYTSRFKNIFDTSAYWKEQAEQLRAKSDLFSQSFYHSTLPPEVMEAVAANLTILKSPTVLRQFDGRLWSFEGCGDEEGCCHGSCTHVWNYAQAIPHLFPRLERSLRHTEFCESQNKSGHQTFRSALPIRPVDHQFHAAADGQLGGIMKVYREWRIHGDRSWLEKMYPLVKSSMDYCIETWDPRHKGVVEEPHHNTYDIEFWGPDGMCTSFYLGALTALIRMGEYLKKDISGYRKLLASGVKYTENELFNGEYFFQKIMVEGLNAPNPVEASAKSYGGQYSEEARELLRREGPKYQYGNGCLSDGVLGCWIASMCGLPEPLDSKKVASHLLSVHKYNLKENLSDHANPQRPSFAFGDEGGLLLCSWPKGGKLSLPFVYSDEVWTGIEYQVASHLMLMGKVEEGLDIVRACRDRYDGRSRNPFNEYECGHWYARALSSYGLLTGLTGLRYDAVDKTLHINSQVGDFTSFISTEGGFGNVSLSRGVPKIEVVYGAIPVDKVFVAGKEIKWSKG